MMIPTYGSSLSSISTYYAFTFSNLKTIALKLTEAIKSLNQVRICHLDIRAANVVIQVNNSVPDFESLKLIDFDYAMRSGSDYLQLNDWRYPPELMVGPTSDIYMLGTLLLQLMFDVDPSLVWKTVDRTVIGDSKNFPIKSNYSCNESMVREFVFKCLERDPASRYTAEDAGAYVDGHWYVYIIAVLNHETNFKDGKQRCAGE